MPTVHPELAAGEEEPDPVGGRPSGSWESSYGTRNSPTHDVKGKPRSPRSTVLFVTLEFWREDIFSGNGTYGRTIIKGLVQSGYRVGVLCCSPSGCANREIPQKDNWITQFDHDQIIPFTIPVDKSFWGRLDWKCCYEICSRSLMQNIEARQWVRELNPRICLPIDWSGVQFVKPLLPYIANTPMLYFNFRVFSANTNLDKEGDERRFYERMEAIALRLSTKSIALSLPDKRSLLQLYRHADIGILHIPVRSDLKDLASVFATKGKTKRNLILQCCRLSPEKNIEVFFDSCIALKKEISAAGLKVFICGKSSPFGEEHKKRLRDAGVPLEERGFLSTEQLAEVMSRTAINFHPSLNEPYGMTIIEAGASGAITICNHENIGAIEVMGSEHCVETDMSNVEAVTASLSQLIGEIPLSLERQGKIRKAALWYNQEVYNKKLTSYIKDALSET